MSELELEPRQESPRQSAPTIKLFPFEPLQSLPRQSSPTSNLFLPAATFFLHPAPDSQLPPSKNPSSSDFRTAIIPLFTQTIGSFSSSVCHQSIFHLPSSILHPRRSTLANQQLMSPVKMTDTTGAKRKRGLGSPEKGNCIGPGIPPKRGRASVEPASQDGESAIIKAEPDLDVASESRTEPDLDAASESETQPGSKPANEEQDLEKPEEQDDEKPNEQVDEKPDEQVEMVKRSPSASPRPVREEEEDKQCSLEQNVDPVCATSLPSETTSTKTSVEREAPVGKTPVGKTPVGRAPVDKAPASPRHTHRDEDIAIGKKSPRFDTAEGVDITAQTAPSANDGTAPATLARPSVTPAGPSALPASAATVPRRTRRARKRQASRPAAPPAAPMLAAGTSVASAPPARPPGTPAGPSPAPARPSAPPATHPVPPRPLTHPLPPRPPPRDPVGLESRHLRRWRQDRDHIRTATTGVPHPSPRHARRPPPRQTRRSPCQHPRPRTAPATSPGRPTPRDRQPVHRDVQGAHKALRPCGRTAARSRPDGA